MHTSKTKIAFLRNLQMFFFIYIGLMYAQFVWSAPVPALDIDKLIHTSDLIVVIEPLAEIGKARVLSVIHGDGVSVGDQIIISTDNKLIKSLLRVQAKTCIFLKKTDSSNIYHPVEFVYDNFRVDFIEPTNNAKDRQGVEMLLMQGLYSSNSTVVSESVRWLMEIGNINKSQEIIKLAEKENVPLAVQALALKLQVPDGNTNVLNKAIDFVVQSSNVKEAARLRWEVAWSFSQIKKTSDTKYLNTILLNAPDEIKKALCFSAIEWADNTSISSLLIALKNVDKESQYRCILCLGKLTGESTPPYKEFMTNPSNYVSHFEEKLKKNKVISHGSTNETNEISH